MPARAGRVPVVLGLAALVGLSAVLRSTALDAGLWIDEALSVGIAQHDLGAIPGVLRQDGSPPLYYVLLHGWMGLVGEGEAATRALSLALVLLTVPVAWAAGRQLAGPRAGWCAAVLAATHPFLTYYAQETRMYALVVLLSLVTAALFAAVVVDGRRRARAPLVVSAAALLLTHAWSLFLVAGAVAAAGVLLARSADRRAAWREGALVLAGIAVLVAWWVPTFIDQLAHTAAPWSSRPGAGDLFEAGVVALGGGAAAALLAAALTLGPGRRLVRERRRPAGRDARLAWLLAAPAALALLLAFAASQVEPAWASRYVAVAVGPLLLAAALGLAWAGRTGLVALAGIAALGLAAPQTDRLRHKDELPRVVAGIDALQAGDLVVSLHPERGPLARYELGSRPAYADLLGRVPDARVFDWRDAVSRLQAATPGPVAAELVASVPAGRRVLAIAPDTRVGRWTAPWTRLVARRAAEWERALRRDPRLRLRAVLPPAGTPPRPRGVRLLEFVRRG